MASRAIALLLSGGGGTRLWPLSSDEKPKQFLTLLGGLSLYQETLKRVMAAGIVDIVVVANAAHERLARKQAEAMGLTPRLVLEPMRRDSAAAIAAGVAAILADHSPDTVIAALPCDHRIGDDALFAQAIRSAEALAVLGYLGTFGIQPAFPATDLGYIERGAPIPGHPAAFRVTRFHEKPKLECARAYLAGGRHDWNSGMFVFRADLFAAESEKHMPAIATAARAAVEKGKRNTDVLVLDADAFACAPQMSIDHALFEKSERVGVIPVAFAWSDVGSWPAVHAVQEKDPKGNAVSGDAVVHDGSRNLIVADGLRTVVVGVDDLVVITSRHGVLVAPRARAHEIKPLIAGPAAAAAV
jgi:mannose-1-phosphate guanylyltransferase/mannose-6-phosphate isomerase